MQFETLRLGRGPNVLLKAIASLLLVFPVTADDHECDSDKRPKMNDCLTSQTWCYNYVRSEGTLDLQSMENCVFDVTLCQHPAEAQSGACCSAYVEETVVQAPRYISMVNNYMAQNGGTFEEASAGVTEERCLDWRGPVEPVEPAAPTPGPVMQAYTAIAARIYYAGATPMPPYPSMTCDALAACPATPEGCPNELFTERATSIDEDTCTASFLRTASSTFTCSGPGHVTWRKFSTSDCSGGPTDVLEVYHDACTAGSPNPTSFFMTWEGSCLPDPSAVATPVPVEPEPQTPSPVTPTVITPSPVMQQECGDFNGKKQCKKQGKKMNCLWQKKTSLCIEITSCDDISSRKNCRGYKGGCEYIKKGLFETSKCVDPEDPPSGYDCTSIKKKSCKPGQTAGLCKYHRNDGCIAKK